MPASHREPASSHLNSIFLVSMSVYNVTYPFSAYNVAYLFSVYDVAYLFSFYNVAYPFSVYIRDCRNYAYAGKESASHSKCIKKKKKKILGK